MKAVFMGRVSEPPDIPVCVIEARPPDVVDAVAPPDVTELPTMFVANAGSGP